MTKYYIVSIYGEKGEYDINHIIKPIPEKRSVRIYMVEKDGSVGWYEMPYGHFKSGVKHGIIHILDKIEEVA